MLDVSTTKKLAATLAAFGWPPIMRMEIACRYACRSRWTLQRAVEAGVLLVAGKQGRSWTFRKEDLDRWLIGTPAEAGAHETSISPKSRETAASKAALARIDAVRKGQQ